MTNDAANHWLPLTVAQEWMRRLLAENEQARSTVEMSYRITGPLDVAALVSSIGDVVRRHDALRLTFDDGDRPGQRVRDLAPDSRYVTCTEVKGTERGRFDRHAEMVATRDATTPWDPRHEMPFRFRLLRLDPEYHALLATFSQVAIDGGVRGIVGSDLWAAYRLRTSSGNVPPLDVPSSFVEALRGHAAEAATEMDARVGAFWRTQLSRVSAGFAFFSGSTPDIPVPGARTSVVQIDGDRLDVLRALIRRHRTSEFVWLQAALATALFPHVAQDHVAIWVPVDLRGATERRVLGAFTVTLPLVVERTPNFADVVNQTARQWHETLRHRRVNDHVLKYAGSDVLRTSTGMDRLVRSAYIGHPGQTRRTSINGLTIESGAYPPRIQRATRGLHMRASSWPDKVRINLSCDGEHMSVDAADDVKSTLSRLLAS